MQLLVSVRDVDEAHSALEGEADVIDAKDPLAGALGPVSLATFRSIVAAVASRRPVSAALGDIRDGHAAEREALAFARAGAAFVKVGFAGIASDATVATLMKAAATGASAGGSGLVAAAYADFACADALSPDRILDAASRAGASGVLLDTVRKDGPAALAIVSEDWLAAWVNRAHSAGLFAAVAGRLLPGDLPVVLASGADVAGVRGAACDGGRDGRVSVARVRDLRAALRVRTHHRRSMPDLVAASGRSRGRAWPVRPRRPT